MDNDDYSVSKTRPIALRAYLGLLVPLLLLAGTLAVVMSTTGCGEADPEKLRLDWQATATAKAVRAAFPEFFARIDAQQPPRNAAGDHAFRRLGAKALSDSPSPHVTLAWTPPPGATGYTYSQPPQPGGPPFV